MDPLCPADMPPPACAPVPAFPLAPTCAPAMPDIPYSKPAIKAVCDICFKLHVPFIMPPSPLRLASIDRERMICPLLALFRSISRITAWRWWPSSGKKLAGRNATFSGKGSFASPSGAGLLCCALRSAYLLRAFDTRASDTRRYRGVQGGLPHSVFKEELTEGVAPEPGIVARSDYTA